MEDMTNVSFKCIFIDAVYSVVSHTLNKSTH